MPAVPHPFGSQATACLKAAAVSRGEETLVTGVYETILGNRAG
jgi:hypothetical protein